jgi:hypothetical protein
MVEMDAFAAGRRRGLSSWIPLHMNLEFRNFSFCLWPMTLVKTLLLVAIGPIKWRRSRYAFPAAHCSLGAFVMMHGRDCSPDVKSILVAVINIMPVFHLQGKLIGILRVINLLEIHR